MRVVIYRDMLDTFDQLHCPLLAEGFEAHGCSVQVVQMHKHLDRVLTSADLVVFCTIKRPFIRDACNRAKVPYLLADKAYFGRSGYLKLSLGGYVPSYLDRIVKAKLPRHRLLKFGVSIAPRVEDGTKVIYAGSSDRFMEWHGLPSSYEYAAVVMDGLPGRFAQYEWLYRPKPAWWKGLGEDAKLVPPGMGLSTGRITDVLSSTHCLITYGSNAAVDAIAAGVPVIVLAPKGDVHFYSCAETDINRVERPFWPTEKMRLNTLSALTWCQFDKDEVASGFAWSTIQEHASL